MTWESFWKFFSNCEPHIKKDILRQLDLPVFLSSVSTKVRIEILKFAPVEINRMYNPQVGQGLTRIFK